MTFRPPVTKPTRRRSHQTDVRRNLLITVAFGLVIVLTTGLLGSVLFANWYSDHGTAIGSVNGAGISKDDVRERAAVNLARYQRQIDDYGVLRAQGTVTGTEYTTLTSSITTAEAATQRYSDALSQLTQELTLQQYADKHGINVSDADVNAQMTKDGTIPAMRHVLIIGVRPTPTPPASVATAAQITAAQTTAQGYLDSIKSGAKKWADVDTLATANGGVGASGTTGDIGLISSTYTSLEPAMMDAIFGLAKVNDYTPVMVGQDGIVRFATVTEITTPYVDKDWQSTISSNSSSGGYHSYARAQAIEAAVRKSVEGQWVGGSVTSRHVQELFVLTGFGSPGAGSEVKMKLIMFAPNHDTTQTSTLDPTAPAWADAKKRADDAYAAIQKDPTQFDVIAKDAKQNDDPNLSQLPGGDYPWIPQSILTGDASSGAGLGMSTAAGGVAATIYNPNQAPGLIAPILEPTLGYILVDLQGTRPAPATRVAAAALELATGSSFADMVAKYSEAPDAPNGGDMGWISHYEYSADIEAAIFQAPIGGISRIVTTSNGYFIFKVLAERTQVPTAAEQAKLKTLVYDNWAQQLAGSANVWTDSAGLTALTPASPTP
jgi:parvulin-like peptidyl-prolyl isomerase